MPVCVFCLAFFKSIKQLNNSFDLLVESSGSNASGAGLATGLVRFISLKLRLNPL